MWFCNLSRGVLSASDGLSPDSHSYGYNPHFSLYPQNAKSVQNLVEALFDGRNTKQAVAKRDDNAILTIVYISQVYNFAIR